MAGFRWGRRILQSDALREFIRSEHMPGMDFYLNASMIDSTKAPHIREVLRDALKALDNA